MTKKPKNPELLIVTGLSGAGMSSTLKALEDFNFEAFDNFPLALLEPLVKNSKGNDGHLAVGVDSRTRGFNADAVLKAASQSHAKLLFLTCDENILRRRFTETRRRHPLAKDRPVIDGIRRERRMLWDLQSKADIVLDTSELSIHDLRRILVGYFGQRKKGRLTLSLKSFGYKYGIPREADIVMDARFLKNPHWDKKLKPKTGLDKKVATYIESDKAYAPFLKSLKAMLKPLLPRYAEEGKTYLTIAIGCTGGRHRSVHVVETLSEWLKDMGYDAHIEHRDIGR